MPPQRHKATSQECSSCKFSFGLHSTFHDAIFFSHDAQLWKWSKLLISILSNTVTFSMFWSITYIPTVMMRVKWQRMMSTRDLSTESPNPLNPWLSCKVRESGIASCASWRDMPRPTIWALPRRDKALMDGPRVDGVCCEKKAHFLSNIIISDSSARRLVWSVAKAEKRNSLYEWKFVWKITTFI